jgi:hypothetical protein
MCAWGGAASRLELIPTPPFLYLGFFFLQAFVLVEKSEDAVPVYVWIGGDYEKVEDPEDEEVLYFFY